MKKLFFIFLFIMSVIMVQSEDLVLARVEIGSSLKGFEFPIYAHLVDASSREYVLTFAPISKLEKIRLDYEVLDFSNSKLSNELYFIALERRKGAREAAAKLANLLHDDGRHAIVRATEEQAEALSMAGFDIEEINDPLILKEYEPLEVKSVEYRSVVAESIASVEQKKLYDYTGNLSGENTVSVGGADYKIVSRYTKSGEPIQKATQYVYEFMQKLGFETSYHNWTYLSTSNRNVVANKPGTTKPEEIVLVTAHFDSMPSSSTNSPGADDNASGSAAIMVVSEILKKYQFERTIRFVFFTGEELGLYGSKAYADKVATDKEKIVAVYNMDMIAWDSTGAPTLRIHTRTTSNSGYSADKVIADTFVQIVNSYKISLSPIIDADGISASDHSSFWKKGYAGVLAIEDDDSDFCANYHTSRDKLATLNMTYFTNYVKAGIGTIAQLSNPIE